MDKAYMISVYVTLILVILTIILTFKNNPLNFITLFLFGIMLLLSMHLSSAIDNDIQECSYAVIDKTQIDAVIHTQALRETNPMRLRITSDAHPKINDVVINNKNSLVQFNYTNNGLPCVADTPSAFVYSDKIIKPMLDDKVTITIEKRATLRKTPLIKERIYTLYIIDC